MRGLGRDASLLLFSASEIHAKIPPSLLRSRRLDRLSATLPPSLGSLARGKTTSLRGFGLKGVGRGERGVVGSRGSEKGKGGRKMKARARDSTK